jgi:Uracil DNA glycosylase superfamily
MFWVPPKPCGQSTMTKPRESSQVPVRSLGQLAKAEETCKRCQLYRRASQVVPGEGPRRAAFMLVGEQPGDKEDLAGKPFFGPAGRLLDQRRRWCASRTTTSDSLPIEVLLLTSRRQQHTIARLSRGKSERMLGNPR